MNESCVYVICLHPLVCDALLSILQQTGIQVIGRSADPSRGLTEVYHLQPQIVLLEGVAASSDLGDALRAYVGQATGRQLLILDPDKNVLSTYTHQDQIVQSSDDLIKALGVFKQDAALTHDDS